MSTDELTPERLTELYEYSSEGDDSILKGIDSVNWEDLEHAHGSAYDVPALLRAAISPIKHHRDFAFILLHETVWHQGTIYQASSYVVPFLYAMMRSDDMPDRDRPAFLLASLANGYSEDQHIIHTTQKAIEPYIQVLLPYTHHQEPSMRSLASRALSHYPQHKTIILPELIAQRSVEDDKYVVTSLQEAIKIVQEQ